MPTLKYLAPNFVMVDTGTVTLWFSYETIVAYQYPDQPIVISENRWSKTTGKHLSMLDSGSDEAKSKRLSRAEFDACCTGLGCP